MAFWTQRRRAPHYAERCMVATSHVQASQTALKLLRAGGSAVDAAIGAALTLSVVEPHMVGLGGDAFALVAEEGKGPPRVYNGSGAAPAGFDIEQARREALNGRIPRESAQAVTLPGAVDAFGALHAAYGKLLWDALFEDAIHLAEQGFIVGQRVAYDWASEVELGGGNAAFHALFEADQRAPRAGEKRNLPALAKSLKHLARHGRDGFYDGWIAEDLVATLQAQGGKHALDDFDAVEGLWVDPISAWIRSHEVFECPPNGQGITALMMMQALSGGEPSDPASSQGLAEQLRVAKLVYQQRDRWLAEGMSPEQVAVLLGPETSKRVAAAGFDEDLPSLAPVMPAGPDTVYLAVVDEDRLCVSLMASLYDAFGSKLMGEKSGIVLHSRGRGFSLEAGHANLAAPNKRPLHTLTPAMVADTGGRISHVLGVMGGQYQPQGQTQVLLAQLEAGLDPQAALDLPRVHWNPATHAIEAEPDVDMEALMQRLPSQTSWTRNAALGGGQVIQLHESGLLVGGSDPRKEGCVLGL